MVITAYLLQYITKRFISFGCNFTINFVVAPGKYRTTLFFERAVGLKGGSLSSSFKRLHKR
jgi:hypothetical protein